MDCLVTCYGCDLSIRFQRTFIVVCTNSRKYRSCWLL